jgi:hypothetical protein
VVNFLVGQSFALCNNHPAHKASDCHTRSGSICASDARFDSVSRLPSHAIRYQDIAIENLQSATAPIRARAVQEHQTNLPGSKRSTRRTTWISTRCYRRPTRPWGRLHRSHHPRSPLRRCYARRTSAQCVKCRRGRRLALANKSPPRRNRMPFSSRSPPQASRTWQTAHDPYTARWAHRNRLGRRPMRA